MPTHRTPAIEVVGLRKSFGDHVVLDGIDLTVPRGTVLALLGPNGAGKTTTVNILSTLIRADGGSARVAGHDVATDGFAVRSAIGVTGQFSAVDGLLTTRENLRLMGDLGHLDRSGAATRAADLLARFALDGFADKPASTLSGGMRRKLDLAMTLMGEPNVVFLDEPTTGLDPRSRHELWDIVRGLVTQGVTILLTTQYLDEADELADAVAVLDGGRIVAHGTPAELKRRVPGGTVRLHLATDEELREVAAALPGGTASESDRTYALPARDGVAGLRALLDAVDVIGVDVEALEVSSPGLDDVFLALTGGRAKPTNTTPTNTTPTNTATATTTHTTPKEVVR